MIQIDLQPEMEAQLAVEAKACGVPLEEYVKRIVTSHVLAPIYFDLDEDLDEALQEGLEDIAAGRTRPAREVFDELHKKYGIVG